MSSGVRWKQDFPIRSEEDSYVTRREFTKILGLASIAFFVGTLAAAARRLWTRSIEIPPEGVPVARVEEIAAGSYKLFRHPADHEPYILLRLAPEKFVAFSQSCTHLKCPVHFNAAFRQLVCPCHNGAFSAENGQPLAGPPQRPLPRLATSVRDNRVWVGLSEKEHT